MESSSSPLFLEFGLSRVGLGDLSFLNSFSLNCRTLISPEIFLYIFSNTNFQGWHSNSYSATHSEAINFLDGRPGIVKKHQHFKFQICWTLLNFFLLENCIGINILRKHLNLTSMNWPPATVRLKMCWMIDNVRLYFITSWCCMQNHTERIGNVWHVEHGKVSLSS